MIWGWIVFILAALAVLFWKKDMLIQRIKEKLEWNKTLSKIKEDAYKVEALKQAARDGIAKARHKPSSNTTTLNINKLINGMPELNKAAKTTTKAKKAAKATTEVKEAEQKTEFANMSKLMGVKP